ncbi:MAG TPA: MarR family transcriptional regulator [Xanthomonadales bacterium]|nr:MarR family transcriptional regulator [Xanthomonadales bacterium]
MNDFSERQPGREIAVNPTEFMLEEYLPYRLSLLSNTVSQGIADRYQQDHDISVTEWRVIVILGRFPGLAASDVVEKTAIDKVTISRAVRNLVDKGFLQRRIDKNDRRKLLLYLTRGKGKRVLESIVPLAAAYENELLASLSSGNRALLEEMMHTLQEKAEKLCEHPVSEVA